MVKKFCRTENKIYFKTKIISDEHLLLPLFTKYGNFRYIQG